MLPAPRVAVGKDWFVNGEGQTFAVVRGPVTFTIAVVDVPEPDGALQTTFTVFV